MEQSTIDLSNSDLMQLGRRFEILCAADIDFYVSSGKCSAKLYILGLDSNWIWSPILSKHTLKVQLWIA